MPSDMWNSYRMEWLQQITKIRSADKCKEMSQRVTEYYPNPWTMDPGTQQKTMLEHIPQQIKQKMTPKFVTKNMGILGVEPPGHL